MSDEIRRLEERIDSLEQLYQGLMNLVEVIIENEKTINVSLNGILDSISD